MRHLLPLLLLMVGACGPGEPTTSSEPTTSAAEATPAVEPTAAPTAGVEEPLPGDPVAGEPIFQAYCVACHMPDGTGLNGTLAADWVNDPSRRARSDAELLESIAEGVEDTTMVAWSAMLSEQQHKDVLAYVRVTFMGHSGRR